MNSTLRQKLFRSTLAASLVLLPLCCLTDTKAQQSATQTPASGVQNLHPSVKAAGPVTAKGSDAAAKDAAENPVAAAISLPLQNNTFYGVGPYRRAENELLIEPVVPIRLSENWMVISRTIVPVVAAPKLSATGANFGLSNIQPQFYLSPVHAGKLVWGVGPQLWLPTATDHSLGINKWGGGPAAVALFRSGHLLAGTLIGNQFAGVNHVHENQMTINPFFFYNLKRGWYVVSAPIMTADWTAERSKRWTVPVGGGAGRLFKIGSQMLNARVEYFNDVRTTTGGPGWQLQTQLQFLFIRHKK